MISLKNANNANWFQLLYGMVSVMMLLALIAFSYATWRNVETQTYQSLKPHNHSLAQVVSKFLGYQQGLLASLSESIELGRTEEAIIDLRLRDVQQATPQMKVLALLNRQQQVISSTGKSGAVDWSGLFSGRPMDQAVLGLPFRPSFIGQALIPFRVPVLDSKQRIVGYLVAGYQLVGETGVWEGSDALNNNFNVMVVSKSGQLVASHPENFTLLSNFLDAHVAPSFMQDVERAAKSAAEQVNSDYEGNTVLLAASSLSRFGLYVVSTVAQSSLLGEWFDRMKYVCLAVLSFLLVGLVVFRIIMARASRFEVETQRAKHDVHKLSEAIEKSPSSVIVADSNWVIEYANKRLQDGREQNIEMERGQQLLDVFPHKLLNDAQQTILETLQHGSTWYGERLSKEQKQWYSFSISSLSDERGKLINYVIITQNITDRKRAEVKLYKQANFDPLTGLPNRRRTAELIDEALKRAWQNREKVAMLYMDVDSFKQVNDTYGHLLGDQMLQVTAGRLSQAVDGLGQACHMSGDEFLVFMHYQEENEVTELAEHIHNTMRGPIELEGKRLFVTVSIGISRYPHDCSDVQSMLKNSDIALYASKSRGRNCYSFFDSELDARNKRRIELENELRHALGNGELYMVYQTKNHISNLSIYGFEALMRWNSKKLGFVGPDEFITVAEEIGVIDRMGEFALRQACIDLKKFQQQTGRPLTMAVNVSMQQLATDALVGQVSDILQQTGLDPSTLELEITESMLAESIDDVMPILDQLLALGVSMSIDDFGTGYSSLSYLTRFPVNTLKIDRAFVMDMATKQDDAMLTETIITMAHKLNFKVVAEGIEDMDQVALLRQFNCDIGQGYYFTRPLPLKDMTSHLQEQFQLVG